MGHKGVLSALYYYFFLQIAFPSSSLQKSALRSMAFKRRLTAQGPAMAYDTVMSSDTRSAHRVRLSSSIGNEWSAHEPGNKDQDIGASYGQGNQNVEENDVESARDSPYMRFQSQWRPANADVNRL